MKLFKIAAAYIRVSDEKQDEYSPDSQLKKIREHAAKEGYQIPEEYIFYDDGISGRSVKKRDDFKRMISTARDKSHPFDRIYVWKFSRFARNQEEAIVYKSLLSKEGVSVVSISEPLPDGPFGSLIERIIEWEDEFYSSRLSEEVQRGFEEKALRGEPVVPPPYGYKMVDGEYVVVEEEAEVVREVFRRYINGEKQRPLAIYLGDIGIRTRYNKRPDARFVDYMVCNKTYLGKIWLSLGGARAIGKRDYDNESIRVYDGKHQPIITQEIFDKAQEVRKEQKKKYPKYARRDQPIQYMLKGIARCSSCGGTLVMSNVLSGKSGIRTMQCHNYARGQCSVSHSVVLPKIEGALLQGLESALGRMDFNIIPSKEPKKNDGIDYDKLIAIEERRLERAKDAYLSEVDTIEQYKENKKEIEDRIAEIKAKRDEQKPKADTRALSDRVADVVAFIKREDASIEAKNEMLRSVVHSAVYDKANETVAVYFNDL